MKATKQMSNNVIPQRSGENGLKITSIWSFRVGPFAVVKLKDMEIQGMEIDFDFS